MAALLESTSLPVTSLYAGLLSILFALLSLRIGLTRASTGVMHGDSGKQDLVRKARVSIVAAHALSLLGVQDFMVFSRCRRKAIWRSTFRPF